MKFLFAVMLALVPAVGHALPSGEALRLLPVQDNGRVKPYDTFARETLELIYGKKAFEGKPAWQVVFTWLLAPAAWTNKELFEVRHHEIVKTLGLDPARRWYKGEEIFGKERFSELMQELRVKRESKEKLTPVFQAMSRLENQYFIFREMAEGRLLRVLPDKNSDAWKAVADLDGPARDAFVEVSRSFIDLLGAVKEDGSVASDASAKGEALDRATAAFETLARAERPEAVPSAFDLKLEVHYNDFHPFRWAYIFYLLSALAVLLSWVLNKPLLMRVAWPCVIAGFLIHTYGFGLRIYLAGRPPVSNMYETVIWVAWGGVLFSCLLEAIYRRRFILLAGTLGGMIALIVADSAPVILDPSLQPLEAVLRSNYWLVIHVMTITISYAAFFLAFMLGDIGLILQLKDRPDLHEKTKELAHAIYRCFQIGVAFLAPGIILGGVWADYSWGRFWGWDPKETWALIVLLGYLAILHGRMANWIRDFGMIVSAVATFSLVIMAWYGVNFVLGAGLHSYGFGAGGVEYVSAVLFAHGLLLLYVSLLRKSRLRRA